MDPDRSGNGKEWLGWKSAWKRPVEGFVLSVFLFHDGTDKEMVPALS